VTINSSSVHATSTASATGLLAKVLIPSNDKLVTMFRNEVQTKFAMIVGGSPINAFVEQHFHLDAAASMRSLASRLCSPNHATTRRT
jgi:hypothetical protein